MIGKTYRDSPKFISMKNSFIFCVILLISLLGGCDSARTDEDLSLVEKEDERGFYPYCTKVLDYYYAPGQHAYLAKFPDFVNGDSCTQSILLGGWGGFVILAFDHDVLNNDGKDVIIYCGSSVQPEPGIVYMMQDENKNGLADETWYEIKGSEYDYSKKNYQLTYYAPKEADGNVLWRDNEGYSGELTNSTMWWWKKDDDSITFRGTLLPEAYCNSGDADGEYWKVKSDLFRYGYAENGQRGRDAIAEDYSKELRGNVFDISDVVDELGNPVELKTIRFVKIQTGVFQRAGWLGEISTEINGVGDLNLLR